MKELKVTIKDIRNIQKAYSHYEISMRSLKVMEDPDTRRQATNAVTSMKRTFDKIENVLLEKLKEQDK